MMELLLEADRALANGALDQAERLYWQLLERDARNAIAVAGLAEISLRHGDLETARLFTLKALAIDPENATAHQLRAALERDGVPIHRDAALPLLPVQQLEAVGRRRMAEHDESSTARAGTATDGETFGDPNAAVARAEPAMTRAEPRAPAPEPAPETVDFMSADDFAAAEAAATVEAIDSLDDSVELEIRPRHSRGRPRAIRMPRLPTLDDLEPGEPHVQADASGPAYPPQPGESPRAVLPQPPVSSQPPASTQPPVSRIAGALAQPGVPWLPPQPLPPAASPENGDKAEEDAEAAAFREAMALLQNGAARVGPDRLKRGAPVESQTAGLESAEPPGGERVRSIEVGPVRSVGSAAVEPTEVEPVGPIEPGQVEPTEVQPVTSVQPSSAEPGGSAAGEPAERVEPLERVGAAQPERSSRPGMLRRLLRRR